MEGRINEREDGRAALLGKRVVRVVGMETTWPGVAWRRCFPVSRAVTVLDIRCSAVWREVTSLCSGAYALPLYSTTTLFPNIVTVCIIY